MARSRPERALAKADSMFVDFLTKQIALTNQRLRDRGLTNVLVDRDGSHRDRPLRASYKFEQPLDLGLSVSAAGYRPFDGLTRQPPSWSAEAHHRDLTGEFAVYADEPERLQRLMTPEVTDYIFARYRAGENPSVDDAGCSVVLLGSGLGTTLEESAISGLLGSLELLVRKLETACVDVPAAGPLAPIAQAVEALGAEGVQLTRTPLYFTQTRGLRTLCIRAPRVGRLRFDASLSMGFDAPLKVGLSVRPRTTWGGLKALFGRPAIVTGDEAFDDAFHVDALAADTIGARDLLPQPVRKALCDLAERVGEVHLDDMQVRLSPSIPQRTRLGSGAALVDAVAAMEELVERIERARWSRTEVGPYR